MSSRWLMTFCGILGLVIFVGPTSCQRAADSAQKKDQFAEDRRDLNTTPLQVDEKRVMTYLKEICELGPRVSGSDAMKKQQKLLQEHFEKWGAEVKVQKFMGSQPSKPNAIEMTNLVISWHPERKRRILFAGHYDTRPIADQEPRRKDWEKPFLSANDGTSTTALFMELAHHVKNMNLSVGFDLVLFDAEEYMFDPNRDKFFLGSDHFAKEYSRNRGDKKYIAGILLDLFAGKNARFPVEEYSQLYAGDLLESVWREARSLGVREFVWERGYQIQDDHLALNRAGIPTIDIIDFDYKHWHRLSDTPEQCSGEMMAKVAKVITSWLQKQQ